LSGFMNLLGMIARSTYLFYYKFRFKAYLFNRLIRIESNDCGGNDKIDNFDSLKIGDKFNKINNNSVNNKPKNDRLEITSRKFHISDNSQMNINNNNSAVKKFKDLVGSDQFYSQNLELKLDNGHIRKINRVASERQHETARKLKNINDNNSDRINLKDISYSNISNLSDNKLKKIDEENEDEINNVLANDSHIKKKLAAKNNLIDIHNSLITYKNPVKFSLWENLKISLIYKEKAKNSKFYLKSEDYLKLLLRKFDIFYYLKKMKNLSLIKKCLLEENEIKILDVISNKNYSFKSENNNSSSNKLNSFENFENIIKDFIDKKEISKIKMTLLQDLSITDLISS